MEYERTMLATLAGVGGRALSLRLPHLLVELEVGTRWTNSFSYVNRI
jgi:hypothetical protein